MAIPEADLGNRFTYHKPDAAKADRHSNVRGVLLETASYLNQNLPAGREASIAVGKLEEAMFWANAAIARAPA